MSELSHNNNSQQSVAASLQLEELFELCKSESLSAEELRELIARHGLTQHCNNHVVSDYKFFFEVCKNKRVTEGIIRCLLEYFPDAASGTDNGGVSPLHFACCNKNVTKGIVECLIAAAPDSVRSVTNIGFTPLHNLCKNKRGDEASDYRILKLLIEKHPEAVRHANNAGNLPIHYASMWRSPEFCRVLIEAFPGSERIANANGALLLHCACSFNSLATVEYVYKLFPDAIHRTTTKGFHPIHMAIVVGVFGENHATALEIVQFLLNCDPNQKLIRCKGGSLLQVACGLQHNELNIEAGMQMIKVIYDAHPDSVRSVNNEGNLILHFLCRNGKLDDAAAVQILKFLLEKHPESVRHADNKGCLPIHFAAGTKSPDFCRVLIEAYPGSERMTTTIGVLPLHQACLKGSLGTVEYLHGISSETTDHVDGAGFYPINYAISGIKHRENPAPAVDIVQFLLDCDPNQKLKQHRELSLLRFACTQQYNDSNIEAGIQMIKIIYDAHPAAIEDNRIATNIHRYHQQVQAFINSEQVYARQAKDHRLMTTPDGNGRLPLHRALQNEISLGSIKLLVKGNPSAIRNADNNLAMPLHIACQHHDSAGVLQYLLGLDEASLDAVDRQGNTVLHYACRGAKFDTIALLLEKYDAASVSKQNAHGKIPINLLWESNEVEDKESVEYTGSVFQLVRAYPEMVSISNLTVEQSATRGKKRKLDQDQEE